MWFQCDLIVENLMSQILNSLIMQDSVHVNTHTVVSVNALVLSLNIFITQATTQRVSLGGVSLIVRQSWHHNVIVMNTWKRVKP